LALADAQQITHGPNEEGDKLASVKGHIHQGADLARKSRIGARGFDAEREAELTQLNGKLYTVEKALWEKSYPAIANAPPSSIVR
jgi:hypothetical protein